MGMELQGKLVASPVPWFMPVIIHNPAHPA